MGWSSGSEVFDGICLRIRARVPERDRVVVVKSIVRALQDHDWDCIEDAMRPEWPEVAEALQGMYPDDFREEAPSDD